MPDGQTAEHKAHIAGIIEVRVGFDSNLPAARRAGLPSESTTSA